MCVYTDILLTAARQHNHAIVCRRGNACMYYICLRQLFIYIYVCVFFIVVCKYAQGVRIALSTCGIDGIPLGIYQLYTRLYMAAAFSKRPVYI